MTRRRRGCRIAYGVATFGGFDSGINVVSGGVRFIGERLAADLA